MATTATRVAGGAIGINPPEVVSLTGWGFPCSDVANFRRIPDEDKMIHQRADSASGRGLASDCWFTLSGLNQQVAYLAGVTGHGRGPVSETAMGIHRLDPFT